MIPQSLPARAPIGQHLRAWRQHRRRSQLDLALDAEISQRHLSCLESGRAAPSRDMVLRLADQPEVPLRARNALLLAAGFAPVYAERSLDAPEMAAARAQVQRILDAHAPHPALAVDRHWNLLLANAAVAPLLAGVEAALLTPPLNVMRLTLDPRGLAPRIANLASWRAHILARLAAQVTASADAGLAALLAELRSLPAPEAPDAPVPAADAIALTLELDTAAGRIAFLTTTTVFGSPTEITLSELAVEVLFPADPLSIKRLARLSPASAG